MGERAEEREKVIIYRCIACGTENPNSEQPIIDNNCGYKILFCNSCNENKRHFLKRK
ncbi:MAG: hypothetical protein ACFFDB_00040 [Promethearchaeota archaeon]